MLLPSSLAAAPPASQPEDANQLAREVVWNELHAQRTDHSYWRYHETRVENGRRELLDVFQTRDGEIHRLLAVDGHPLTQNQIAAENSRIENLLSDPSKVADATKKRQDDIRQEQTLLKMLPDAFIFHWAGQDGDTVKLRFVPNPAFHPTSHASEVFHHMEGFMLVDARMKRLVEIDGRLTTRVNFFGGILGHLDAGGTFCVKQRDVGGGHWDTTLLDVHMDGRALFFKTIAVRENETYSGYHRVSGDTTLREAAQFLQHDSAG
ncbi:MAG TPA: hypothetical protein VMH00_00015 [Candidatus Limnocylindrales bacterium]|nr:hypothetical protein [Candidatus Limnocylindrales bacterium]